MWQSIFDWLSNNAMAIFLSAFASWIISKYYYDKANRESLHMAVIYPAVKILRARFYSRKNYEELFAISTSYASKYLRKKERKLLLRLLNNYRDVCRYSEEAANTDCIMAYYTEKLIQNGINPKPCFLKNDEGEVIDSDFPPYYNELQNYIHKIVSSFDFYRAPNECTATISEALEQYTSQFYSNKEIKFFDDQSISEIIKHSKISAEWDSKFQLASESKKEFLELSICQKVISIIEDPSPCKKEANKDNCKSTRKKALDPVATSLYALKNTKYSSVYVVVTLFVQSLGLELLKDVPPQIWSEKISELIYFFGGLLLTIFLLIVCHILIKKAQRQIETQGELMDVKPNGASNNIDWIIEWATTVGYLSPLLYLSAWYSQWSEMVLYKWGIIALVFILGIVLPYVIKRKR